MRFLDWHRWNINRASLDAVEEIRRNCFNIFVNMYKADENFLSGVSAGATRRRNWIEKMTAYPDDTTRNSNAKKNHYFYPRLLKLK